ncbi:MAG: cobalamin biosynthesis protein CbiX [Verrucomicrobiota bacterium]|nr:cobalamin biosynthesis protein CbiX [Verrucomicrobiota bacterium]
MEPVRSTMISSTTSALLIVGHGSTTNPDSSMPSLLHAAEIRRRGIFAEVACCFWKEEPSFRDALLFFQESGLREVYVVPNFISEGYFTQTVIPRELELTGRTTERGDGQLWKYCEPVGNHAQMTELLLQRAREVAPAVAESETSLLIVGHGTSLNDNSAVAAKREVENIRQLGRYAAVLNTYMEEAPLVADWAQFTDTPNVVVVPFFIADGLHSYEDIPVLLGIDAAPAGSASERQRAGDVFRHNPHHLHGRSLYYASSIGTDAHFADVIIAQTEAFDRGACSLTFEAAGGHLS